MEKVFQKRNKSGIFSGNSGNSGLAEITADKERQLAQLSLWLIPANTTCRQYTIKKFKIVQKFKMLKI